MNELHIYGPIGEGDGDEITVTADGFAAELAAIDPEEPISLYLSSPGGVVRDGLTIYADLVRRPGDVIAHVHGIVGSIASVILMAADHIKMTASSQIMIHDPLGPGSIVYGNANELRTAANENEKMARILDGIRDSMADIYSDRTGTDRDKIVEWMADETWLSAEQSLAAGFADEIIDNKKQPAAKMEPLKMSKVTPAEINQLAAVAGNLPKSTRLSRRQQTKHRLIAAKARLQLMKKRD